jgi:hypothetical protein
MSSKIFQSGFLWDYITQIGSSDCQTKYLSHLAPFVSRLWKRGIRFRRLLYLELRIPTFCDSYSYVKDFREMQAAINDREPQETLNDFLQAPDRVRNISMIYVRNHNIKIEFNFHF